MEQPAQKKQSSLLSWVSKKATTTAATATTAARATPLLPSASSLSSSPSSSRNFIDGPAGLFSLDAESHVLYLPGLLKEEKEEGGEKEGGGEKGKDSLLLRLRREVQWLQRDVTVFNRTTPQRRLVAYHSCREDGLRPYTYSGLTLEPRRATPAVMEVLRRIERAAAERCEISLPGVSSSSASFSEDEDKKTPPRLFNSCLLNLYRGGGDCMGWHADDEAEYRSSTSTSSTSSSSQFERKKNHHPTLSCSSSCPPRPPPLSAQGSDDDIVIASASFGERRDFYLRPKPSSKSRAVGAAASATPPEEEEGRQRQTRSQQQQKKVRYSLGEGDVLFMLGQTQQRFQHSVPARANVKGERINLTFRWNVRDGGEAPRVVAVVCKRTSGAVSK